MDSDIQLYFEEQRQQLIDLNKKVESLSSIAKRQLDTYKEPLSKVEVEGKVSVNTEKEVEITNLELVKSYLDELGNTLSSAIEKSVREPVKELTIKNIGDAKSETIKITNFNELSKQFELIEKAIVDNKPIVNIEKQEIQLPTSPTKPIAVRLSDGKSFYNAIASALSGHADFVNSSGRGTAVVLNQDGSIPVVSNSKVSTLNSSNQQLGINGIFTGQWEDITDYTEVIVSVYTTHTSITDGLKVEFSFDGVNVHGSDVFTITASSSRTFSFPAQAKYVRVRYFNDGVATTTFQLQTLLKRFASKGSSHRLKDNLNQEDDAIVTKSQIVGFRTGGGQGTDLINVKVTPSGALTTDTTLSGTVITNTRWGINNITSDATYKYFGFEDSSGAWKIMRKTLADGTFKYATGASGYNTAWTNRASQTYANYGDTF